MHRWRVGSVEIVRIEDDSFALPSDRPAPAWAVPELAPTPDEVGIAFSTFAIADGHRRIIVDPWLANDDPRGRADAAARVDRLLDELAAVGFEADQIDTVVNTHFDGIGWNTRPDDASATGWAPTFTAARHLYPRAELEAWRAGTFPPGEDGLGVLEAAGVLDPVDPPHTLSPHISLRDAPGHNPGHLAVVVEDGDDLAIIPGHLFLTPFQVADPSEAADLAPEVATASRRAVLAELADRDGLLLSPLLGGPGGGRIERRADGYAMTFRD
jgi:glyoxylase-like metal-dependent hydrolase (beta-lactamase superfamily II)